MTNQQKQTFKVVFLILTIALIVLPAITTFNELLTTIVMRVGFYRAIQDIVVPIQTRMITGVLRVIGLTAFATQTGIHLGEPRVMGNDVTISWNCIGWQSFLLFGLTLATGLQGSYRLSSRLQTITIGVLGTFILNILRITLVVLIANFVSRQAGIIFHDYFSTLMTVAWLFLFWWFVFAYVLEKQGSVIDEVVQKV